MGCTFAVDSKLEDEGSDDVFALDDGALDDDFGTCDNSGFGWDVF